MKRSLGLSAIFAAAGLFVLTSCNDASQDNAGAGQDTNYTDTRRNSGDTGHFLKTDTAKQKDLIDVNAPGQ